MANSYNLLTVIGATAGGKTSVAAHAALQLKGEIISADSRQVYRGMDLGTGKDIEDYTINDVAIPYHLIDIVDAGYKYNVYEYQNDFVKAFEDIQERGKFPILCGGSGLYIEAAIKGYKLIHVPVNEKRRQVLEKLTLEELTQILAEMKRMHNKTDVDTKKRAVRAIEIEEYYADHPEIEHHFPEINALNIGIKFDRQSRRKRITTRLKQRLEEGMIEEVQKLLDSGISAENIIYYGLEYKFITQHLIGELSYKEMVEKLNIAIHQFSKRQMTWFRKMEREGIKIHWLDGYIPMEEKMAKIEDLLRK